MRTLGWIPVAVLLAIALAGCPAKPPATRPPAPAPFAPEGWWIETADEVNAGDVGTAVRLSAAGAIFITPAGRVHRAPMRPRPVAPRAWRFAVGDREGTMRYLADGTILIERRGQRVTLRRATDDEARRCEAQLAAAPAR